MFEVDHRLLGLLYELRGTLLQRRRVGIDLAEALRAHDPLRVLGIGGQTRGRPWASRERSTSSSQRMVIEVHRVNCIYMIKSQMASRWSHSISGSTASVMWKIPLLPLTRIYYRSLGTPHPPMQIRTITPNPNDRRHIYDVEMGTGMATIEWVERVTDHMCV